MTIFHDLGNHQPYFNSQKNFPWDKLDFSSRTDARVFYNNSLYKELFFFIERLGLDRKHIRIASSKKIPIEKGWTQEGYGEERNVEQLIKEYQEYGARTGTKIGNLFFEVLDIDIDRDHVPFSLRGRWRVNFELLMKRNKVSYIRTARGYQVYLLLEELSPNSTIYHTDKFGKKRIAGSILAKGRQAQGVGSQFKKWVDNGKWFWHLKNRGKLAEILVQYFFVIENKESSELKATRPVKDGKRKEEAKVKEFPKTNLLLLGKKYNIQARILSKQKTCLADIWKVFYLDQQKQKRYFLVNDYQKPNVLGDLEVGTERSLLLVQGSKHVFFARILTI